ncbi:MAG: TonB-dependent receptor [Burkholderiales bacterium]|nr:TonB-dependent receptor [Burkholderiales bacterium]
MTESKSWRARLCAPCALVLFLHAHAGAQQHRAPEVIVSATRFADTIDRIAVNASVITAEEIARSAARTLPELIGSRAGIFARDLYGNNAALAQLDMRGFGATAAQNTLILVDGRRLNDVDQSGVQWSSIPLDAIERIEILRGSGAVQYGDGASAGVINIVTRHPARAGKRASGALRYGSWDTRELSASLNAFGEQAGAHAFVRNYDSGGYRDNNRQRQSNLALNGTWSGSAADATLRLAADRQGLRLPGPRTVQPSAGIDQLATQRRQAATPLDYAQRDGNQATLDLRWSLGRDGELALGLGYRDKAQRSYFDFGGFPDYRDIDLDVLSLQPRYRWRGSIFAARHTFVIGIDLARWDYGLLRANAAGNIGRPFSTVRARQDNDAVYVMDSIQLSERVSINLGARNERRTIAATDAYDAGAPGAFGSAAPNADDAQHALAYEAGIRVRIANDNVLIARTARSFRFANVDEIYETAPLGAQEFQFLRPQHARTYEIGMQVGGAAPWLQASLFRMDVSDEIHLDPFSSGVGNRNLPRLRRSGLELELRRSLTRDIDYSAAYTYTRARFVEGVLPGAVFTQQNVAIAERTVPLVPTHKLDAALDWRMSDRTRLRTEVNYASEQYMENDEGNTLGRKIPAYGTANLKLQHRLAGALTATLGIANLFDRHYYAYAVRSQFVADRFNAYPLPERSFWIGLEYSGL